MSSKRQPETNKAPGAVTPEASEVHQTTTKGDTMNSSIQTQSAQLPVIAGHEIAIDEHGRFNLNAIHKASGEGKSKAPSTWTVTKQAKELIQAVVEQTENSGFDPIESVRGGRAPGTFAHELLAVSYAGWISPRFQLQVNQVFLDYRMGKLEAKQPPLRGLPNPLSPSHQRELQKAIAARIYAQVPKDSRPAAFKKIYSHLKDRFNVAKYDQIDESRYTEALGAVHSFELDGEWLPQQEQAAATLSDDDLSDLYILLCHAHIIEKKWRESHIEEALSILHAPIGGNLHENIQMAASFARRIAKAKGQLMERSRERLGLNYGLIPTH